VRSRAVGDVMAVAAADDGSRTGRVSSVSDASPSLRVVNGADQSVQHHSGPSTSAPAHTIDTLWSVVTGYARAVYQEGPHHPAEISILLSVTLLPRQDTSRDACTHVERGLTVVDT